MVVTNYRFARSGGEANAIAIRIAHAASGKDKMAVCGDHGWHDRYLAANLNDDDSLLELMSVLYPIKDRHLLRLDVTSLYN